MLLANYNLANTYGHYYERNYALRSHARELACLAELILAIYEKIHQFAKSKVSGYTVMYYGCGIQA